MSFFFVHVHDSVARGDKKEATSYQEKKKENLFPPLSFERGDKLQRKEKKSNVKKDAQTLDSRGLPVAYKREKDII